jgi:hypothetical protein
MNACYKAARGEETTPRLPGPQPLFCQGRTVDRIGVCGGALGIVSSPLFRLPGLVSLRTRPGSKNKLALIFGFLLLPIVDSDQKR